MSLPRATALVAPLPGAPFTVIGDIQPDEVSRCETFDNRRSTDS